MRWASAHWTAPGPAYLTLLGDGHYNMKGFNPRSMAECPSWIPPYLVLSIRGWAKWPRICAMETSTAIVCPISPWAG